jgi:hypothetical protein
MKGLNIPETLKEVIGNYDEELEAQLNTTLN